MSYSELLVTTNFTFLQGASHPEELVEQAATYGYAAIAITDRNTFAGIVRAHAAAKKSGIRIIVGCRLDLLDGPGLLAYPTDKASYSQLSNLLTLGNSRAQKGECNLYRADVFKYSKGVKFVALPPDKLNEAFKFERSFEDALKEYYASFRSNLYIAASRRYQGDDSKYLYRLVQLSKKLNIPIVATNNVHYHTPSRRQLQDIVTCIREKCTIYNAGFRLHPNAERYLKPEDEMLRLFRQYPEAVERTQELADACQFSLDELQYEYPEEITSEGRTPQQELTFLSWEGARQHFGENIPEKTIDAINYELAFIEKMNYAPYFLTVYDIVRYARSQGILCQGRGSAANSTVCYCLGITSVNPAKFDLLFERFISAARNEKALLKISLGAARELKEEMIEITDKLLAYSYSHREAFDSLRETVLTSNNDSLPFIITLPEQVIKLADDSWYQEKSERHKYDFGGSGIEGYYSIRSQWHHDYFPASALQTPVYYLLHFAFPQTIKFILDFTNRTVDAYFASGFDSSVHEIEVTIHSIKTKQFISAGLWSMYRGTGSPVTPYLLQSIHMALEKYLLEIAKSSDKKILQDWLIHLLQKRRSASITAVVTSVVLAYPDGLFDVAAILFQHYDFFRYDNRRSGTEEEAKSLYSLGRGLNHKSKEYEDERIATCAQPHRKLSLENLALQYQYFKNEGTSEEEVARRQTEIWRIIDHLHTTLPSKDAETDYHKAVRLLLTRIDRRKMNPTLTHEGDKTIIAFNPSLEPDLKEHNQEGLRVVEEKFKYSALKAWATNKFRSYSESFFPKYEENPDQVLKETKEIVEMLQHDDNEFHLYNSSTPAYTCATLIKGCSEKLSKEEFTFCNGIILSYAMAPLRENYAYQIADGVEVAVSTLPFLYKQFPEHKSDYNHLLLFILFDSYPIGEYKRICDYAIEALNDNLFRLSPDDANVVLLAYLTFKPKFDQHYNLEHRSTLRKLRAQALEEFAIKYESELGDINSTRAYYEAINFDSLGIQTAETAFQIIPVNTTDPIHFDFIKKVLGAFSSQILAETDYSDKPKKIDYKLKHRFYRKYSSFLLHRDIATIKDWTQPFVDAFTISREMADFISDVVSEEDRLRKYDNFWTIWECFYPAIKSSVEVTSHRALDEIIRNYLLAWPYWRDDAKEWHSLKTRETVFFKKVSMEMGHHPAVLYSISKLLNEIGASFLNDGLVWLADMLSKNVNLHSEDLHPNTIYYLEAIVRKYVYLNRTKLKTHRLMKDKVLILLDFLVSKGSVNGYLLREDIF